MKFKTFDASSLSAQDVQPQTSKSVDTSSIDRVMRLDPHLMTTEDLDTIIAYMRKARALFVSGEKPKRGVNAAGEKVDMSGVMASLLGKKPDETAPKIKRI